MPWPTARTAIYQKDAHRAHAVLELLGAAMNVDLVNGLIELNSLYYHLLPELFLDITRISQKNQTDIKCF